MKYIFFSIFYFYYRLNVLKGFFKHPGLMMGTSQYLKGNGKIWQDLQ